MIAFKSTNSTLQLAFTSSVATEPSSYNSASSALNRKPRPTRRQRPPSGRRRSAFLGLILGVMAAPVHAYTLSLEPSSLTVTEGDQATITAVLSKDGSEISGFCRINADIVVRQGGTAQEGDDFNFMPQNIKFSVKKAFPSPSTQEITITIIDDSIAEASENFALGISVNPQLSYCFPRHAGSDATVTIKDNDTPP